MGPLVSVVVPSFNQAHYLPIALDSVLFQDYPDIEVLVCNHGSTDATSRVIARYVEAAGSEEVSFLARFAGAEAGERMVRTRERRYPARTIRVFESSENIGGSESYNAGFRNAHGKYCMYLVGDDYLYPNAVSRMVSVLEENRDLDVVYADMFVVDDSGRILQHLRKPEYSFAGCLAEWFHLGVCRLYRRELHDKVGYYDRAYRNANDYDLFLRFAMSGAKFRHIGEVLYCVRNHDPENPSEPASWRNNGYANLLRESVRCAERAREFLRAQTTEKVRP